MKVVIKQHTMLVVMSMKQKPEGVPSMSPLIIPRVFCMLANNMMVKGVIMIAARTPTINVVIIVDKNRKPQWRIPIL